MIEELSKLYNTMRLIETKGESTMHMAACLNHIANIINRLAAESASNESGD